MSAMLPVMAIAGGIMNKFISTYMQMFLKYVAEDVSLAEEVISTIRTAQAFGIQMILSQLYNQSIDKSQEVDMKAAIRHGGGLAMSFFFSAFVPLSSTAVTFRYKRFLGNSAITHGRGAAAKLYDRIVLVLDIDSANPEGLTTLRVKSLWKMSNSAILLGPLSKLSKDATLLSMLARPLHWPALQSTSALDMQSEGIVKDALDKAAAGRTTIMIVHRLSTIKVIDVIYVMGEGQVLESGSHNDLLQRDGAYARLAHAQKLRTGTAIWSNMLYTFSQPLTFFVIALIFWFGAMLVSRQEASTFQFFIGLMSQIFGAIQAGNVFSFVPDISSAKGAGSDIIKLLDSRPEIDAESTDGKVVAEKTVRARIRFENIHFRYPVRLGWRQWVGQEYNHSIDRTVL
ncbi:hypothetical protein BDZ97DRAFT_1924129 [Flammula alnicola]|nr:hypothetical protein BDZ97DRAFT_1924129 [Flammula alnicola]